MAVRDQDHGGVAVPVTGPLAGSFLQPLDLLFGQIFPGPELGIGGSAMPSRIISATVWSRTLARRSSAAKQHTLALDAGSQCVRIGPTVFGRAGACCLG